MGSSRMHLCGHRYGRKLQMKLHTLQDLHKAIMAYGGKQVRTNNLHEAPGSVPLDVKLHNHSMKPQKDYCCLLMLISC